MLNCRYHDEEHVGDRTQKKKREMTSIKREVCNYKCEDKKSVYGMER